MNIIRASPLYKCSLTCYIYIFKQGNLKFDMEDDDSVIIVNKEKVRIIASLLGTMPSAVEKSLCYRVVAAKGEVMEKAHNKEEVIHGRDALAKVSLHHYIVEVVAHFMFSSACSLYTEPG